ncbi:MAG TPA: APC family permease [Gemmatimonadaceae bacterium]|nr:APC family permease [Gemmatimonadaceae bacterium]
MTTNSTPVADAGPPPDARLVRAIGTIGLAASIVNVTIGGGIFRLPSSPDVAGRLGAAAPLAYLICAVAMGLIVVCIAEAGSRVSLTGGPYAYVEVAFGRFAGFLVGVLLWLTGTMAFAAVATIFVDNVVRFVPAISGAGGRFLLLAAVLAVLAVVNILGVRQGTRLNALSTAVKLVPLLLLIGVGIFAIEPANLRWPGMPAAGELSRASIFLIFAFAGIESALVPSGEVRDPARTVPRAVFLAMGVVTVIYILLHLVAQGTLGPALVGTPTPLVDAAGKAMGGFGIGLLSIGVVLSTFGYLSGMTLAVPRALFAFARDGFLPRQLKAVHARYQTPHIAIITQVVIVVLLAATNGFEFLAIIANVAALLVYLGCALAAWQLRRTGVRASGTPFAVPGGAVAPVLATIVIIALLSSITLPEWSLLGMVLATAILIYVINVRAREA